LKEEIVRWDQAFQSDRLRSNEPETSVVRFIRVQLHGRSGRLLDLGCGFGRHLVYSYQQEFTPVGVDFSIVALNGARSRLQQNGLKSLPLIQSEFGDLPLASHSFVAAISIQAIYHGTRNQVLRGLVELNRVLQPAGVALVSFLSDRSSYFGQGDRLEEKTYRLQGGVDSGAPHHFMNQADLQRICAEAGFILSLLRLEEYQAEGNHRSSMWLATIKKSR
jgi:ubiquinone/menaquinone biosynthesis C-methylase UbiE